MRFRIFPFFATNKIDMRLFSTLTILLFACSGYGQVSGTVKLDHLGMEFTIPSGWIGQPTEGGYVLGSHSEPGAIFLTSHESTSIDHLRQEATSGIYDEGIQLQMVGEIENLSATSIGASYSGFLQGQAVKAYGVGLINPHGTGVSVLAMTTPELFTSRHVALAKEIAQSFRFSKAATTPIIAEWKNALTNARLTYLESYSTDGGGYSNKIVIDLCGNGYFSDSRNYSMNMDTGGAFGSDFSKGGAAGTWDVIPDVNGNAILQLKYQDGSLREYTLSYVNDKTLLNGTQYFRTYDSSCR